MRVLFKDEYLKDLKRTFSSYLKTSKISLNNKAVKAMTLDREKLIETNVLSQRESKLYNDTSKFSKIMVASMKDASMGKFNYAFDDAICFHVDSLYYEPYYSEVMILLDDKTRTAIEKIIFTFKFSVYHPFKDKVDIKVNKYISTYALDSAILQFKALWMCMYTNDLPLVSAQKMYEKALAGAPTNVSFDNIHFLVELKDTISYKSATKEYGEYEAKTIISFDLPDEYKAEVKKKLTPEEIYLKMLGIKS